MKIYVGYILTDYSRAVCMSTDKKKVEQDLKDCKRPHWVTSYELSKDLIEFDCD